MLSFRLHLLLNYCYLNYFANKKKKLGSFYIYYRYRTIFKNKSIDLYPVKRT